MKHLGNLPIETERLILRPFRESDAQAMYDGWASDPDVARYCTWPTHENIGVTKEVVALWTQPDPTSYNWCIAFRQDDICIGAISVGHTDEETETMEIGYCIAKSCWGKGATAEAATAVLDFLFYQVGARRIIAKHDPKNPNSGKVMKKAGMRYLETRPAMYNTGPCEAPVYFIDRIDHRPMTDQDKRDICEWKYPGEYAENNLPPYEEMKEKQMAFLHPEKEKYFHSFFIGEKLIGFARLEPKEEGLYVGMGVHPDHCNQGYGRRILAIAAKLAQGKTMFLEVRTNNQRAINCYRHAGFEIEGEAYELQAHPGTFYKMIQK